MKPFVFLTGSLNELGEARRWYRSRSNQAFMRFESAFQAALDQIANTPDRWPAHGDGIHRFRLLTRFPYNIVYREATDRIYIVAVAHSSRKPSYWKRRDK